MCIRDSDYTTLTLYLNDELVDLDKFVTVKYGKRVLFKGRLKRKESTMRQTLFERNDWRYMFPNSVNVTMKPKKAHLKLKECCC